MVEQREGKKWKRPPVHWWFKNQSPLLKAPALSFRKLEQIWGRGALGPRGWRRGKQQGLTHTHPQGWDWTLEGFAGSEDVLETAWPSGEMEIPQESHCDLKGKKKRKIFSKWPTCHIYRNVWHPYYLLPVPAVQAVPAARCVSGYEPARRLSAG